MFYCEALYDFYLERYNINKGCYYYYLKGLYFVQQIWTLMKITKLNAEIEPCLSSLGGGTKTTCVRWPSRFSMTSSAALWSS